MPKVELRECDLILSQFVFTWEYAFFVVMGGVGVEWSKIAPFISLDDIDNWHKKRIERLLSHASPTQVLTMTHWGVLHLAKNDFWIYIPKDKIVDRSKADQIQKALVLLQVSWLVLDLWSPFGLIGNPYHSACCLRRRFILFLV